MLYIIKQYKKVFLSFMVNNLNGEQISSGLESNASNDFLSSNREAIINYIKSLDLNKDNKLNAEEDFIHFNDINNLNKILTNLQLDKFNFGDSLDLGVVIEKIESYANERNGVLNESRASELELRTEVSEKSISLENLTDNELIIYTFDENNLTKENVTELQRALVALGYELSGRNRGIDGSYGPSTEGALKNAKSSLEQKLLQNPNNNLRQVEIIDIEEANNQIRTIEETDSDMEITFGRGRTDFIGLRENINNSSFETLIKSMSFTELQDFYNNIVSIANNKNLSSDGNRYNFRPTNIGDLRRSFEEKGYKTSRFIFDGIEMGSLFELVRNVYLTQEKLKDGVTFRDKLAVIFDYNQDGIIDNDVRFYTLEKEFLDAVETEAEFENLLKNLGYSSREEFNKLFFENYYSARANFKNNLGSVLSGTRVLNPGEMLNDPNALKNFNEFQYRLDNEIPGAISNFVDTYEKTGNLPNEVKEKIKLQALGAVVGSSFGLGASFDVRDLTRNLIDSAGIGFLDGVPGLAIGKNIIRNSNGSFRIDMGAVNLIPLASVGVSISETEIEEFKNLFPADISSSSKISFLGGITPTMTSIGLNISRDNIERISLAKNQMSDILDQVFEDIKSGKSFEESSFYNESSHLNDRNIYGLLSGLLNANGGYEQYLKEGVLNNYERSLYDDVQGNNLTGAGVGLIFLSGYLPIPIISVQGQNIRTNWSETQTYTLVNGSNNKGTGNIDSGYLDSNLNTNSDLLSNLSSFESGFSWRTRYNGGSIDFLTPSNDLETRWNGLLQLSRGVKALRDVNLNSFLLTVNSEDDKWVIISTLSQYMKRANDFDNGNIDNWNEKVSDFIQTDRNRRKGFDTMFGFSLNGEAEQYYRYLEQSKGNIGSTKLLGVGFDATSSVNVEGKPVRGIDTLYTNLSILTVNGEPLLVPITDSYKIEAFKNTILRMSNISQEVKENLIAGIDNGTIELNFYKDPEGFDDRILPIFKSSVTDGITTRGQTSGVKNISVFQPNYNVTNFGVGIVGPQREKDVVTDQTSTPGVEDGGPDQTSTPGVENEMPSDNFFPGQGVPDTQTGSRG